MSQDIHTRIPSDHPSINPSLLSASPEAVASAFVACGDLSVDDQGRIWRHRRKVGGNHNPRMMDIPAVRAENIVKTGRHQVQLYVVGHRVICLAARVVWFLNRGEIPAGHHIHHINGDLQDNRLENLSCVSGSDHIRRHGTGRQAWNKGSQYGKTDAYLKSNQTRKENHAKQVKKTVDLWNSGLSAIDVAEILGICSRQVYTRLQSHKADDHV